MSDNTPAKPEQPMRYMEEEGDHLSYRNYTVDTTDRSVNLVLAWTALLQAVDGLQNPEARLIGIEMLNGLKSEVKETAGLKVIKGGRIGTS